MQRSDSQPNNHGFDVVVLIVTALIMSAVVMMCHSCKQVEYVTVPEVHHEYHHTTDSVKQVDSIFDRQTTIIREVDSATMAQYGIKLENAQKAWLIQNERLMKEIERLKEVRGDTVVIQDSIPYPVEKIVKEPYTPKFVQVLAWAGGIGITGFIFFLVLRLRKILPI